MVVICGWEQIKISKIDKVTVVVRLVANGHIMYRNKSNHMSYTQFVR
jgi:hypothetical protein